VTELTLAPGRSVHHDCTGKVSHDYGAITMATATQTANLFELSCEGTQITYSTSSFAGPPLLDYSGPEGHLSFSGNEIETLAIKTTNRTTNAGPPAGAAQTYEPIALHGVAKSVAF
jgi:hypothetical protein